MLICICNALRDEDFQNTKACTSAEDAMACLGCGPQCGQCLDYIDDVLLPATAMIAADISPA